MNKYFLRLFHIAGYLSLVRKLGFTFKRNIFPELLRIN